jgi:peptidase E
MKTTFILHGGFDRNKNEENLEFYQDILSYSSDKVKILLVCFATEDEKVDQKVAKLKNRFQKVSGNKILSFEVANRSDFRTQIQVADIIYFCGGQTFRLLGVLKEFPALKDWIKEKVLVGESAGANVWGKYFYSPNADKIEKGLGFIPIKIIPHFVPKYAHLLDKVETNLQELNLPEYTFKVFEVDL